MTGVRVKTPSRWILHTPNLAFRHPSKDVISRCLEFVSTLNKASYSRPSTRRSVATHSCVTSSSQGWTVYSSTIPQWGVSFRLGTSQCSFTVNVTRHLQLMSQCQWSAFRSTGTFAKCFLCCPDSPRDPEVGAKSDWVCWHWFTPRQRFRLHQGGI